MKKRLTLLLAIITIALTLALAQPTYAYAEIDPNSDFSSQKIVFLGDSITMPYLVDEEDGFVNLVVDELGFGEFENYGVGASTIADQTENTTSFVERYATMDNDADYVIVFGGINDYQYDIPMGNPSSTTITEFNGALNELYEGLLTRYYPNATIFVMTPLSSRFGVAPDTTANAEGWGLDDYVAAMKDRAVDGINIIDLYNISNMNASTSDTDYALYNADGHHPNERGHRRIADILISAIAGTNLYTDNNLMDGFYLAAADGTTTAWSEANTTDYIEIEEGRDYIIYGSRYYADNYQVTDSTIKMTNHITFFDNINSFISGQGSENEYYTFTAPTDCDSIRITVQNGTENYQSLREIKNYILVEYEMNGADTSTEALKITAGGATISEPETPIKAGEEFLGWYTDVYLTEQYDFDDDVITDDVTLYAKWTDSDETPITGGTVTTPTATLEWFGVAWYWYALGAVIGVYYFGYTDSGRKLIGLKKRKR